jgi:hypothetical protein
MAARIDDEAVMAMLRQFLAEVEQRRQVKIHRDTVDEDQRSIRFLVRRRQQRAMQPFVVRGFETVDLGLVVHKDF